MPYGVHCKQLFEITTDKLRYSTRQHDVLCTNVQLTNKTLLPLTQLQAATETGHSPK